MSQENRVETNIRFIDDNGYFLFNRRMEIPFHMEVIDNKYVTFVNYVFEKNILVEMTLTPKWKIPFPDEWMPEACMKRN